VAVVVHDEPVRIARLESEFGRDRARVELADLGMMMSLSVARKHKPTSGRNGYVLRFVSSVAMGPRPPRNF